MTYSDINELHAKECIHFSLHQCCCLLPKAELTSKKKYFLFDHFGPNITAEH